jgi:hypothetical protein
LASYNLIAKLDDRTLVKASVLIGALILLQVMHMFVAFLIADHDGGGIHEGNSTVDPGNWHHA